VLSPSDHHIDGTDVETPRFAAWRGVAWERGRYGVDSYIDPVDNFVYPTRVVRQAGRALWQGSQRPVRFGRARLLHCTGLAKRRVAGIDDGQMLPDSATAASVAFLARGGPTYVASERAAQANQPRARSRRERHVNVDGSVLSRESDNLSWLRQHTGYKGWCDRSTVDIIDIVVGVDGLLLQHVQPRSLGISAAAGC
jgi:hypothetical protein